ncbi:hypothetical protein [Actinomadura sp. HBU206391]|uniref:hypothetical protein n=1 Tax=Actinomadura sp. HBU206391 TaxID=2731692 RepID=UPI001650D008|nr:hypothetical protein [Actinomadura sp. HBU206391]MBC6457269.1 hypothetical protein [Actinomadura sp. HBU206391]
MTDDRFDEPTLSADQVMANLSLTGWERLRYVLLGVAGLTVAALVGSLWATEPGGLPARTHVAFAALTAAGLGWAGFAAWVLSRRGPLFARDRVIAGGLALGFSTVATGGIALIAIVRGELTMLLIAVPTGLVLVSAATALLVRARAHRAALLRRKRELQRGDR